MTIHTRAPTSSIVIDGAIALYGTTGDIFGDGTGFTDSDVLAALASIGRRDITVRINSGGGDAFQGIAIYNALQGHPGKVSVVVDGIAASAASVIAMAGDTITLRQGALLM